MKRRFFTPLALWELDLTPWVAACALQPPLMANATSQPASSRKPIQPSLKDHSVEWPQLVKLYYPSQWLDGWTQCSSHQTPPLSPMPLMIVKSTSLMSLRVHLAAAKRSQTRSSTRATPSSQAPSSTLLPTLHVVSTKFPSFSRRTQMDHGHSSST